MTNHMKNIRRCHDKRHELAAGMNLLAGFVVGLLLIHFAEAMIWACFYLLRETVPDFETALYFSLSSYTTIGYGDVILAKHVRLVGVVEGLVGTFMCGWSVALLVALLHMVVPHNNTVDKKV